MTVTRNMTITRLLSPAAEHAGEVPWDDPDIVPYDVGSFGTEASAEFADLGSAALVRSLCIDFGPEEPLSIMVAPVGMVSGGTATQGVVAAARPIVRAAEPSAVISSAPMKTMARDVYFAGHIEHGAVWPVFQPEPSKAGSFSLMALSISSSMAGLWSGSSHPIRVWCAAAPHQSEATSSFNVLSISPVTGIQNLAEVYKIRDVEQVKTFLAENASLMSVLDAAPHHIREVFGSAELELDVVNDPEEGWRRLYIVVKSRLEATELIEREASLLEGWYASVWPIVHGLLSVTAEAA